MTSSDILESVCSSGCVRRTHLKQISVSSKQPKKYIDTKLGGVHRTTTRAAASPLIFTVAAIVLVYWRGKKVCCVRRTHLEQISVSFTPPRKCIVTKLGGFHRTTSRAAASPLIFNFGLTTHRINHEEIARCHAHITHSRNHGRVSLESHSTFMAVSHTGPPTLNNSRLSHIYLDSLKQQQQQKLIKA